MSHPSNIIQFYKPKCPHCEEGLIWKTNGRVRSGSACPHCKESQAALKPSNKSQSNTSNIIPALTKFTPTD